MSYKDKEKRIKEQRTIEATGKGLMGFEGKLGVIVQNMGQPIIAQDSGMAPDLSDTDFFAYSGFTLDDLIHSEDEGIKTIEQYDQLGNPIESPTGDAWGIPARRQVVHTKSVGWHFDGLSRGHHLEIKLTGNDLIAHYQGNVVYAESAGDLKCYVPGAEWETKVDGLFQVAKKKKDAKFKTEKTERIQENAKEKTKFLDKIKTFWGI